jgi:Recombinase
VAAGERPVDVLRELERDGLETRQHRRVAITTWLRVLRNPLYAGRLVTGLGAEQIGDWRPLISADVFARVQARLAHQDAGIRTPRVLPLRERLHARAAGAFATLNAAPNRWPLVREHHLLRWREESAGAETTRADAERRVHELRARRRRLDDAYLVDHAIDLETYQERRAELGTSLQHAEAALQDAAVETWDVDSLLDFAIAVRQDASQLWTLAADTAARVRLQWVLFPGGLVWTGSDWSNPRNCWLLSEKEETRETDFRMASPAGTDTLWTFERRRLVRAA